MNRHPGQHPGPRQVFCQGNQGVTCFSRLPSSGAVAEVWQCPYSPLIGRKAKHGLVLVNEELEMVQKVHTQQAIHT